MPDALFPDMALKLAVIDDEEPILKALRRLFAKDYEFHAYSRPEEFLAALSSLSPAIVLTDLAMPGMSGLELTQRVIAAEKMAQVVMMTGAIEPARVLEAYRAGVSDFLLKPWDDADLREAIDAAARRYRRWFRLAYPGQREPV